MGIARAARASPRSGRSPSKKNLRYGAGNGLPYTARERVRIAEQAEARPRRRRGRNAQSVKGGAELRRAAALRHNTSEALAITDRRALGCRLPTAGRRADLTSNGAEARALSYTWRGPRCIIMCCYVGGRIIGGRANSAPRLPISSPRTTAKRARHSKRYETTGEAPCVRQGGAP